jgi:DNA-directed RNA polymerase subunit RPC12/RpoP
MQPTCPDCGSTDLERTTEVREVRLLGECHQVELWFCRCRRCGTEFATAPSIRAEVEDHPSRVDPTDACPRCGADDQDLLIWLDDRVVECVLCGTKYEPGKGPPDRN